MSIRIGAFGVRSRRWAGWATAALAVAALACACSGTTQQSVTVTPAAVVAESAHTTLAQKTAAVTITGTASVVGHQIPITGNGTADFASQLMSLDVTATFQGTHVNINELLAGGKLYLSGKFAGMSFASLTGKDWISLPLPASAQQLYGSDPFAQLRLLEQQGAAVTPLGEKSLNGRTVTGYSIVPSEASISKAAQGELSQLGLSQSQTSRILSALQSTPPPTITVWFDSSHLLRQTSVNLSMGGALSGSSFVMQMNVDRYGVPVSITPPSPSDTVTFQQFLQDTQKAG
jgi:hypothetical protein